MIDQDWMICTATMRSLVRSQLYNRSKEKQGKAKVEDTEILESRISLDKDEVSEEERPWNDMAKEILEQIISHLFVSDCIRFRLTCKGWTAITSPLRSPPPPFESSSNKSPWSMFFPYNNSGTYKFFNVMYNDTCLMYFPELQGAIIRHSKYGWLLVSGSDCSIFFFNPFTRAIIELPDLDDLGSFFTSVSFSSPPTSSNCIVFTHEVTSSKFFLMWVCRHGEFIWTPYYIDVKVPFMASHCNPIFYDNVLYILGQDGRLGVFSPEEDEDESIWRVLPKLIGPKFPIHRSFIVESDGELLSTFIGHLGCPIGVFKLDRFKMKWVEVESLGDRMLFVSHTTSILASASMKGTENKIYFPRFHGNNIVFYSLWTGKYHCFRGNFSQENWYDTDEQWYCTWIEPNFDIHSEGLNWFENPPED